MNAKLVFGREEIEEMVVARASKGGFTVIGDPVWDEGAAGFTDITVSVRPMTPEEKVQHDEDMRPLETRVAEAVAENVYVAISKRIDEREDAHIEGLSNELGLFAEVISQILVKQTSELAVDLGEWAGILINKLDKSAAGMLVLDRKIEGLQGGQAGALRPVKTVPAWEDPPHPPEDPQPEEADEDLSAMERVARARMKRVHAEIEDDQETLERTGQERGTRMKKEYDNFPEEWRVK